MYVLPLKLQNLLNRQNAPDNLIVFYVVFGVGPGGHYLYGNEIAMQIIGVSVI